MGVPETVSLSPKSRMMQGNTPDVDSFSHLDQRVRYWIRRQNNSEELKLIHWKRWRAYWGWYRSKITPLRDPSQWWRSNEYIPTPFKIVETILPQYLIGMFQDPDWFTVEARHARVEEYENLCQQLLRQKIDQMKVFPKIYDAIKYCTIMGHVWGKVMWDEQWMRRKVLMPTTVPHPETGEEVGGIEEQLIDERSFNGPQFDWVPLDKMWPDPSGRGRYYIEQIDTTLEELQETQDRLGIYDKEQFAMLESSLEGGQVPNNAYDEMAQSRAGSAYGSAYGNQISNDPLTSFLEGIPWNTIAPQRDGIGVTLRQCWGWVRPDLRGADKAEWRLVVIANGRFVLRDIPSPTPDGKPPYFPVKSVRLPGLVFGESILYYVGPMADQQTRLANMRLDEVFLGIWQSMLIKQGALGSDNSMYFKPGGYMEVKMEPGTRIQDVISITPRAPLLPQVWQEDMYRQTQAEHAAGATESLQGVGSSSAQTATQSQNDLMQGSSRHMLQKMLFGYELQKELLERTWEWLRMRMTDEEKVKLGEEYAAIDLRHIQAPIDITIGGGLTTFSKQARTQRSQMVASLLQNPLFAQIAKPIPIFKQLLSDEGIKNVDRFMLNQEELDKQQMQQKITQLIGPQGAPDGAQGQGPIGPGMDGSQGMAGQGSPETMPNMPEGGMQAGLAGQSIDGSGMGSGSLP